MIKWNRMIKKEYSFFILFFLISSCSYLTSKVESMASPKPAEAIPGKLIRKNLNCSENNRIQILLDDESTLKFYYPFMPNLFENKSLSFIQKSAMLALVELMRRPDEASPAARLQYYLRYNKKDYYFDFRPKNLADNSKMSYLKGIDFLLKTFDKSKSLANISEMLEQYLPQNINLSPDLESFIQKYKKDLTKNETLNNTFFKGDEVLTKFESFKRISFKKIVNTFNSKNISDDSFYDFSANSLREMESDQKELTLKCNFDLNKETTAKEDFVFSEQRKSHYFALKSDDNFFIAVSSAVIQTPFKNYDSTYFIKSLPAPLPLPICQITNGNQDIVLFSTSGRNPSQHLKHLISYDINLIDSFQSLEELLKFSRHLFLSNPDRILYESKRGRKSQLDFFLTMNFPIYHVESLGDIIGMGNFKKNKKESLIADDRSKALLWCAP
ncbi:MAG: hypothetical protein Q7U04_11350 [Bacteriovorax sp.]|nr:hypothetical protein [Bacteriovorax sp.]